MTQTTPTYGIRTPELTDTPNVPSDMADMADSVETALKLVAGQGGSGNNGLAQILCGRISPPLTSTPSNIRTISLGFQPQLVTFMTAVTTPMSQSGQHAVMSWGRLALHSAGGTPNLNDCIGIRADLAFINSRVLLNSCCGLLENDTTAIANAAGTITSDGFSLNFDSNNLETGSSAITIFYTAHE